MSQGHTRPETFSIGDAARASGVSVKAIRYYEEVGLIPRARRRANGGLGNSHRVFSRADVGRLRFIHHARTLGLGLADIGELVALAEESGCPGERSRYGAILERHLHTVEERIEQLEQLRRTLEALMRKEGVTSDGRCTWETCDCMDAGETESTEHGIGGSDHRTGGSHV